MEADEDSLLRPSYMLPMSEEQFVSDVSHYLRYSRYDSGMVSGALKWRIARAKRCDAGHQ